MSTGFTSTTGVLSIDERLRRAREAYTQEKEAHWRTREEAALMRARIEELEARLLKFSEGAAVAGRGHLLQGNESDMDTQHQGNGEHGRSDDGNDGEMDTQNQGIGSVSHTKDENDRQMNLLNQGIGDAGGTVHRADGTDGGAALIDQVHNMTGGSHPGLGHEGELQPECHLHTTEEDECTQPAQPGVPPDVPQQTTECVVQSVGTGPHVTDDDGRSAGRTPDSAAQSEGEAPMGDQQLAAADAGWTAAEMGTCTTAATGQKDRSRRSSNMCTRLKKEPRVRKASRVRGSPSINFRD
ncbi:LOW QUALITY PROTEIN: hypothetical protein Cgig2_017539 [Carnegiea gigantea]|uniref:Uncharacterized protein n=1 Tax=Carnegiea gigantea TaxID=171969 RepID=A0A9Q1QKT8_9CARY|nr:LOW QUALITY PROTEIN: hypothetical protein Cgig2_017539 [Carnegiea gigantea]